MSYADYKEYLEEELKYTVVQQNGNTVIAENSVDSKRRMSDLLNWMLGADGLKIKEIDNSNFYGLLLRSTASANETISYLDESPVCSRDDTGITQFNNSARIYAMYIMPNDMKLVVGVSESYT